MPLGQSERSAALWDRGEPGAGRPAAERPSPPSRAGSRGPVGPAAPGSLRAPQRHSAIWSAAGWVAFALALAGEFVWRWPHLILR
jgi:hypothetical protein